MSQKKEIREHLESGRSLTPLEALRFFGCYRLSARIGELRKEGLNIKTSLITRGNKTFAKYSL